MTTTADLQAGDSLAYMTTNGWAFSGHYFSKLDGDYIVTRESFACGTVRYVRHFPSGWAVIRGTKVVPIVPTFTPEGTTAFNPSVRSV